MKSYEVRVEATSYITVEAESAEDARESVRDIFSIHTADYVALDVLNERDSEDED